MQQAANPAMMSNQKVWTLFSILPVIVAVLGYGLSYLVQQQAQGSDVPIAHAIRFTLAELLMLVAGLGIIAYIKTRHDGAPRTKLFGLLNVIILFGSGVIGFNAFLQMVA